MDIKEKRMRRVLITAILSTIFINANGTLEILSIEDIPSDGLQNSMVIQSDETKAIEYKEVKIKDGGVEQIMLVEIKKSTDSNISTLTTQSATVDRLASKEGIIIDFKTLPLPIKEFEKMFNLKLKEKLQIGYYIFENQSTLSDIELIDTILKSEIKESLKTVRPDWKMGVEAL
jgi:hypothetical protein